VPNIGLRPDTDDRTPCPRHLGSERHVAEPGFAAPAPRPVAASLDELLAGAADLQPMLHSDVSQ
jgi:hypothetical protein